ncbi:hypothetical protein KIN20_038174 [Parelaphostrongylus tenuis]|uniref:Uncharacterized protein n=1 Tax=Parelaphostrongylus tenuis TaxID=148309 RepID=A0AAD5REH3_PARTN|nr:hypothetical protein KIN20_038174 [Parelaphostrongylus tenuis]
MPRKDETYCIIVGNTVTGICTIVMEDRDKKKCSMPEAMMVTTTNIIMANWPRAMWQSVVDRAVRMLASSPFGSHFFSARAM